MGDAFITRRGGGTGVKLKLTAYATYANLPASATDGAVAVITTTSIGKVTVDITQPITPVAGDVWLKTAVVGRQRVPILAQPLTNVYPSTAAQYNGSAWVSVRVLVYHAAWVDIRAWLYDTGNMCTDNGGSWVIDSIEAGYGSITFGASAIVMTRTIPGAGACMAKKNGTLDFTPFATLKVVVKKTSSASSGIFQVDVMQGTTSQGNVAGGTFAQNEVRTLSLDVSAMNVTAFPRVRVIDAATFEVQQMWLE